MLKSGILPYVQTNTDRTIKLKDGRTLGYTIYGNPTGKPLFFFHGWPACRFHAQNMDEAAKKLSVRIISIDRPGYGLSDFKQNRTLLDWPDDVKELADQLKIKKFAVMGVSGGGPYAIVCAYKLPHRITKTGIVVGLAPTYIPGILEGMGFASKLGWANYNNFSFLRYISSFLGLIQARYIPFMISFGFWARQDKRLISKKMKEFMLRMRKEAFRQGVQGPELDLKLYTGNWGFNLKDIKTKVYLWYGASDQNVSLAMAKYYNKQIPKSKLTIYPNEGHLCQITHAEEILKTLTL